MSFNAVRFQPKVQAKLVARSYMNIDVEDFIKECSSTCNSDKFCLKSCQVLGKFYVDDESKLNECDKQCKGDGHCGNDCLYRIFGTTRKEMELSQMVSDITGGCKNNDKDKVYNCIAKKINLKADEVKEAKQCIDSNCVNSETYPQLIQCQIKCENKLMQAASNGIQSDSSTTSKKTINSTSTKSNTVNTSTTSTNTKETDAKSTSTSFNSVNSASVTTSNGYKISKLTWVSSSLLISLSLAAYCL